ncbi:hypothetical protein PPSIR1_38429 [Plesiocystis pacifica SIR-1]|uniref:Uncharacterized protein n=1 Tax=Plesiocystis pacifica SIR-1 TaxID=391625 RepID=A6G8K9_9BACT|nr:hypothetical protein PPSIR1_38429 [Plesiocystis pacifica SIR-1]
MQGLDLFTSRLPLASVLELTGALLSCGRANHAKSFFELGAFIVAEFLKQVIATYLLHGPP